MGVRRVRPGVLPTCDELEGDGLNKIAHPYVSGSKVDQLNSLKLGDKLITP